MILSILSRFILSALGVSYVHTTAECTITHLLDCVSLCPLSFLLILKSFKKIHHTALIIVDIKIFLNVKNITQHYNTTLLSSSSFPML